MAILDPRNDKKSSKFFRQASLLATIPAILLVAPLLGFFVGKWADEKLNTEPYLMILGILLGFAAAGMETFDLVKRSQAIDKEDDAEQ